MLPRGASVMQAMGLLPSLLLVSALAGVSAADVPSPPTGPALVAVQVAPRAVIEARWPGSPYAALLATAWGKALTTEADAQPGFRRLMSTLRLADSADLRISASTGLPTGRIVAKGSAAELQALRTALEQRGGVVDAATATDTLTALLPLSDAGLESLLRNRGPLPQGRPWRWNRLAPLTAVDLAEVDAPHAASDASDAEAWWRLRNDAGQPVHGVHARWAIAPFGLRESIRYDLGRTPPAVTVAADRTQFARLPANTLAALVTAPPATLLAVMPELLPATITEPLRAAGLGDPAALLADAGPLLMWAEAATPLPRLWARIAMPEATAAAVLLALDAQAGFVSGSEGIHLGTLGFLPVQAGWHVGALVITTDPAGPRRADPQPGFAAQPTAVAAIAELPSESLLVAGISRSDEMWPVFAAITPLLARSRTDLATLGTDLRAAARHGHLALRLDGQHLQVNAGGLFGGPLASAAITGEFFRLVTAKKPVAPTSVDATPKPNLQEF